MDTSLLFKPSSFDFRPVKIIDIINHEHFSELILEKNIHFIPGQVIALKIMKDEDFRLYSLASGKDEPFIRIIFDIIPDGFLSPRLARIDNHRLIYISQAFGQFVQEEDEAVWIATGTGVAPFISFMKSMSKNKNLFIHGAKTPKEFIYYDQFKETLGERYIACSSRQSAPGFYDGRLTKYLESRDDLRTDLKYYLCGNPQMVVDVRDLLIAKGIPFNQIVSEIYF